MMKKRGDIEWDTMIGWIIAILVLGLMLFLYWILKVKGINMIEYILKIRYGDELIKWF